MNRKRSLMNIQGYSVALGATMESKKNPSAVAREIGVNESTASRFLSKLNVNDCDFVSFVQREIGSNSP